MIKREWLLGVGLLSGSVLSAAMLDGMIMPGAAQADEVKIGAVGAVTSGYDRAPRHVPRFLTDAASIARVDRWGC